MFNTRAVGRVVALICLLGVGSSTVSAAESQGIHPVGSPEFERIKNLTGTWQGTSRKGEEEPQPASVEYKLTSGGSAVVETLFPGTPHEMVSVYHDRAGKLSMTHYCMLGNQPQLQLVNADEHHLHFSLAQNSDINPATEVHMHALSMTWTDPNHVTQVWTSYEGGKAKDTVTIVLSRVR